jgi:type IV pilus modification protein PilV
VSGERGFTIVEVIIAMIVLTVGLLGLVSTAALTTRMISQGQRYSEAAALANQQFEILRATPCASMANGSNSVGQVQVAWTVVAIQSNRARQSTVTVTSSTGRGTRTDQFQTIIYCR